MADALLRVFRQPFRDAFGRTSEIGVFSLHLYCRELVIPLQVFPDALLSALGVLVYAQCDIDCPGEVAGVPAVRGGALK